VSLRGFAGRVYAGQVFAVENFGKEEKRGFFGFFWYNDVLGACWVKVSEVGWR